MRKEYGDFQTPPELASIVLDAIRLRGPWQRFLEPTCGLGNFIQAALDLDRPPKEIVGVELQAQYCIRAADRFARESCVRIVCSDVLREGFRSRLRWATSGKLLVAGNLPWVTNAELGHLDSANQPIKSNFKGLKGLDALTGAANFDIAEYILLRLVADLGAEAPMVAVLCKSSVARSFLEHAQAVGLPIAHPQLRSFNARRWFGVSVDACLFSFSVGGRPSYEAKVYKSLDAVTPSATVSFCDGLAVANRDRHAQFSDVEGRSSVEWRQGLKHDAADIMELHVGDDGLVNGFGELVEVEPEHVLPLAKGSDVFHGRGASRAVIVPQRSIHEDTRPLQRSAPKLWNYLTRHRATLDRRKSRIYARKPPFSIFGIGPYAFARYKVAIAGFYKTPKFRLLTMPDGQPVMTDDTCYYVPCRSAFEAALLSVLLNSDSCLGFVESVAFWEAKRPVTKKLLSRIDLVAVATRQNPEVLCRQAVVEMSEHGLEDPLGPREQRLALERLLAGSNAAIEMFSPTSKRSVPGTITRK